MDENKKERRRNIKISLCLCFCCLLFGIITSTFFLVFYKNNVLCAYTENKYICQLNTCNQGFWGKECIKCHDCINGFCDGSGKNTGSGKCVCNDGWSGVLCDTCNDGFWGSNCTKCDKCIHGYCNGSNTLNGNGKCICNKPYIGEHCDKCINNYFGANCSKYCSITKCLNGICNSKGLCDSCEPGYTGDKCNKCNIHYKKINNICVRKTNLSDICNDDHKGYSITNNKYGICEDCPKNKHGFVCSNNGNCDGIGTVYGSGMCKCNPNYFGNTCQYSGNIVNLSLCSNKCSGNGVCLNDSNNIGCNCNDKFIGNSCERCEVGFILINNTCIKCFNGSNYWGYYCSKCQCLNGKCRDGITGDGLCICDDGWKGERCDNCDTNYFGKKCTRCPKCGFHGICDEGIYGTGKCICDIGYIGETCNECREGFIKNREYCDECPGSYGGKKTSCNGKGKCIIKNNKPYCDCIRGYSGNTCMIRELSNCIEYNYCNNKGQCIDNECYCDNGYYGISCNMTFIQYRLRYGNSSLLSLDMNVIKENIEYDSNIEKESNKNDKTGESIAISITSVFCFIGCMVGTFFYVKYRPNPIKRSITNATRSHQIELTLEEKEYVTKNPIFELKESNSDNIIIQAVKTFEEAIRLDNNHEYVDAVDMYKKGNDLIMKYLKQEQNAQERFTIAKRMSAYIKREQFLQKCIDNKKFMQDNNILPIKAPVIKKGNQ